MPKNIFDVDEWMKSVSETYEIPAEEIQKAANEIKRGFKRQDDYSREQDALRAKDAELSKFEQEQHTWYGQNKSILDRAFKITKQYGDFDAIERKLTNNHEESEAKMASSGMTEEEKNALIERATAPLRKEIGDVMRLNGFMLQKVQTHQNEFGETLSIPALEKYAIEQAAAGKQYANYDAVYDSWVGDKRKAKEETDREAWKVEQRKEIERDLLSRTQGPYAAPPSGPSSPLYESRGDAGDAANTRDSFVKTFLETPEE